MSVRGGAAVDLGMQGRTLLFAINYSKKVDSLWRADLFPELLTIA